MQLYRVRVPVLPEPALARLDVVMVPKYVLGPLLLGEYNVLVLEFYCSYLYECFTCVFLSNILYPCFAFLFSLVFAPVATKDMGS